MDDEGEGEDGGGDEYEDGEDENEDEGEDNDAGDAVFLAFSRLVSNL